MTDSSKPGPGRPADKGEPTTEYVGRGWYRLGTVGSAVRVDIVDDRTGHPAIDGPTKAKRGEPSKPGRGWTVLETSTGSVVCRADSLAQAVQRARRFLNGAQ